MVGWRGSNGVTPLMFCFVAQEDFLMWTFASPRFFCHDATDVNTAACPCGRRGGRRCPHCRVLADRGWPRDKSGHGPLRKGGCYSRGLSRHCGRSEHRGNGGSAEDQQIHPLEFEHDVDGGWQVEASLDIEARATISSSCFCSSDSSVACPADAFGIGAATTATSAAAASRGAAGSAYRNRSKVEVLV